MRPLNKLQLIMVLILGAAMGYVAATNLSAGGNRAQTNVTGPATANRSTGADGDALDYCRCFDDSGRAAELTETHEPESEPKPVDK